MNLRDLYQEATTPGDRSACPPAEAFLGAPADDVVSHIAQCSACAQEYRIARSFRRLEAPPARRLPWLVAAAAVIVIAILLIRRPAPVPAPVPAPAPAPERIVQRAPEPQIGTPIVDLETAVRGAEPDITINASSLFTLILHLPQPTTHADLELLDASGRVTWRGAWSAAKPESSLTVTLTAPDGDYTLRAGAAAFRFRVRHGG